MTDIDLYEFKETLAKLCEHGDNWIKVIEDKGIGLIEVGKCPAKVNKKLRAMGYQTGQELLVIIQ